MESLPQRLVYVDDELDTRTNFREALNEQGYEGVVATCGSGDQFLKNLDVWQPGLIFLDLDMPDMDGLEVIEALQYEEEKDVPIVLVTDSKNVEMLENYKVLSVIGVLHKPFDFDNLKDDISEIWQAFKESRGQVSEPSD